MSLEIAPQGRPTPIRAGIYRRFSSNMQRLASLEDQERNCRDYAEDKGWVVLDEYVRADAAKSGKKLAGRDALNSLIADAQEKPRPFEVLIMDESSRMARNLEDILRAVKLLKHFGVRVAFVAQKLESDNPNFSTLLTIYGMVDEQNSERLRHGVLRGQKGRAKDGFSTGSRCFGYRSVLVPDPEKPEAKSRADMLGTKWEIVGSEAETIRRIHQLYADGLSDYQICLKFNQEKVPAARKPRIGPDYTVWNTALVKRILKNEKYIGKRIWNKTTQVLHPVTGKVETRKNPQEEWVHADVPELRIVSDELWNRVQERLKIVNEKMTRRRIGGLNRAKKRDYLFSGLLRCGLCGSSMNICASHGDHRNATYLCVSARYRRGCTNNLYIREDRLSAQLVNALAKNLLVPDVMDYLIDAVSKDLNDYLKATAGSRDGSLESLKAREAQLEASVARLLSAIMNPAFADSTAIPAKLSEVEAELKQVKSDLQLVGVPKKLADAHHDIGALVRSNVDNLLEVIKQDVPKARQVLQRHIKHLMLFPTVTETGPGYEVLGEIDLFVSPSDRKGRVLLDRSFKGTVQQYTDYLFRFAGLTVHTQKDAGPNPLLAPLTMLVGSDSDLLHAPRIASKWAELIRSVLPGDSDLLKRVNADYVAWNFRNRAEVFREHFGLVEIVHGRVTCYMFSKTGATWPSRDQEVEPAA